MDCLGRASLFPVSVNILPVNKIRRGDYEDVNVKPKIFILNHLHDVLLRPEVAIFYSFKVIVKGFHFHKRIEPD